MQRFGGLIAVVIGVILLAVIGGAAYALFSNSANSGGLTALTTTSNTITYQELTLGVEPSLVPDDFKAALNSVPADQFSSTPDEALRAARSALPNYLTPYSPVYTINTEGTLPTQVTLALGAPDASEPSQIAMLDMYGWDGASWNFLPSRVNGARKIAVTNFLPHAVTIFKSNTAVQVTSTTLELGETLGEIGSAINIVQVSGPVLQADGTLRGALAGGFNVGQGYQVLPLVRTPDDDGVTLNAMLADPAARKAQIGGLVDLVNSNNYNGVALDYRGLDPARSASFTQFVSALAVALHQNGKILVVIAPRPVFENGNYTTGGYDLRSLGAAADVIELPLGDDLAATGNGNASRMLAWASGEVNRFKLRLLVSALSTANVNGAIVRVPANDVLSAFGNATLQTDPAQIASGSPVTVGLNGKVQTLDYDAEAFAPRFTFTDDSGTARTVIYVTPETLAHQLALAQTHNLGGVSVQNLFNTGNPAGMVDALVQFKVNNAALTTTGAGLSYTVTGPNGVVTEATLKVDQPFTWTASAPGQYSIAAKLNSAAGLPLGSVDVVVPEGATPVPTATAATPLKPVAANTPVPTATPCSGCPTATPAPTTAPTQANVVVGGGGAWGAFELGGQVVHGGIAHAAEMKRAGMTWVKLQAHEGSDMAAAIDNAHAQGFKILLSVVGDKGSVMNPVYQQQYASYMAALASQGADALEVWNEPNIDREWPTGQVNGPNYAGLLKVVYPAIKAANRNTIVISAAPAPTGYFGGNACGNPQGCDDKPFIEGLVAAGGANYLDCVGIHYNEAIVPPSQIGGHPSDNHYTRYYATMVNTYAGAFQNARPLCFTELGILTGEGYPDLASTAPGFAWAAGNTIAEQAAWLAEAASIAKGGSAVRLMIVFNVDFKAYGSDPQAGYAIIRADGACPACDALDAVMP
jgi:hypothetical protein